MKAIRTTVARYERMYGWTNRLLRVDLSGGRIWAQETAPMVPDFLGARGLAAKVLWDEYPEPVGPYHPRNPLMVIPGILTGTRAPYSGRTNICAFGPQCYPYEWFTRSSIGSDWGARLKRAGYDGLIVTGASERPVRILIEDDVVSLLAADELWGLDTIETQEVLQQTHGKLARTLAIGPAGEHLSRIATIQTATSSVAGQGGLGAVMGSKRLKAITVVGTGSVRVADPERLLCLYRQVGQEVGERRNRAHRLDAVNRQLQEEGGGQARPYACTASCPTPCHILYTDVPGCHFDRKWTGAMTCVSGVFRGGGRMGLYDWDVGLRGAMELNMHANRLGLNHWDILVGMIPWLRTCNLWGLLSRVNGVQF